MDFTLGVPQMTALQGLLSTLPSITSHAEVPQATAGSELPTNQAVEAGAYGILSQNADIDRETVRVSWARFEKVESWRFSRSRSPKPGDWLPVLFFRPRTLIEGALFMIADERSRMVTANFLELGRPERKTNFLMAFQLADGLGPKEVSTAFFELLRGASKEYYRPQARLPISLFAPAAETFTPVTVVQAGQAPEAAAPPGATEPEVADEVRKLHEVLNRRVVDLKISGRLHNILTRMGGCVYVGQILQIPSFGDLKMRRGFGEKSQLELVSVLEKLSRETGITLHLGMTAAELKGWMMPAK